MKFRRILVVLAAVAMGFGSSITAHADPAHADPVTTSAQLYSTPGIHLVNDRYWRTACEKYSSTVVRCTTDIFATKIFLRNGRWYTNNDWVFNNLSYLPSPRGNWATNRLGQKGSWVADDGRKWSTECDTPATGRGACRNYAVVSMASLKKGKVQQKQVKVFNSVVFFSSSTTPWVNGIPAAAPARSDAPTATKRRQIGVVKAAAVARPVTPAPAKPSKPSKPTKPSGGVAPISKNSCPSSAPIKGNESSGIYHKPGQRFYTRTNPEVCFATDGDAIRAGYRKAKV